MVKLKDLLKEWNDTSFKDLPKRWSKPVMKGTEPDGLTEFERMGGSDVELGKVYTDKDRPPFQVKSTIDEKMSPEKRAFLMLGIWGKSWQVNLNNVLRGINRDKPGVIKKGLKELKILHKKIEEEIEDVL